MDTTNNTAAYWVAGIIVVLAIILGAWLIAGGSGANPNVPNTGAQQTSGTVNTGGTAGTPGY